jgi:hypothetical protein
MPWSVMKYRDRIIGTVRVRGDRLLPHPKNWRMHPENQRDAMRGVLADLGVARSLTGVPASPEALAEVRALKTPAERRAWAEVFERGTGDVLLLDGHLRAEEIRDQPLPVELLDLDEREQAELLATFDPIGDLATMDREKFLDLAGDFNSTNAAVQALVADLAKVDASVPDLSNGSDGADGGAPDQSDRARSDFALVVTCASEAEQLQLIDEFLARGLECRALI